jgi:uncharacterized SAM-binding protein YcdF (DUF218 family)
MWYIKNLVGSLLLPPLSLGLLGIAGLWLLRRKPRAGKSLLALSVALLCLLSTPIVANSLMHLLEKNVPPLQAATARGADAIVILGGGVYHDALEYPGDTVNGLSLERLEYGAYLQRQTGLPILVTGGNPEGGTPEGILMQRTLQQEFKVPVRWVEARALDTAQNAQFSAALLKTAGVRKVLVVSHAWHLPRARIAFEHQGLDFIAAPTRFASGRGQRTGAEFFDFVPQARALLKSHYALHELIGMLWYKLSR